MSLTDGEIIANLKIKPADRVLDIGGSARQHDQIRVDTVVDLMPPESSPYFPSKLRAKHFCQVDIAREKLPFADKEFDVCLCTHTLEDLYNPFLVLDEMSRVAKRGYVATPSRGQDMEFSPFNLTDWLTGSRRQPGQAHHYWFFENRDSGLYIVAKIYPVLYTGEFFITRWAGEPECRYFWRDEIRYSLFQTISLHETIAEYRRFMNENRDKITKSPVLFYVDNPLVVGKEYLKLFLRRGRGFTYEKK